MDRWDREGGGERREGRGGEGRANRSGRSGDRDSARIKDRVLVSVSVSVSC